MNTIPDNSPLALRRLLLAIVLALLSATAFAAGSNSSGNISGHNTPGATVIVENEKLGLHREVKVAGSGRFRVSSLPIGTYSVVIRQADGSTSDPKQVAVKIGITTRID